MDVSITELTCAHVSSRGLARWARTRPLTTGIVAASIVDANPYVLLDATENPASARVSAARVGGPRR